MKRALIAAALGLGAFGIVGVTTTMEQPPADNWQAGFKTCMPLLNMSEVQYDKASALIKTREQACENWNNVQAMLFQNGVNQTS